MKTVTNRHILIVQMDILQGEVENDHLQTTLKVLNEMSYKQYEKFIESVNLLQRIKFFFKDMKE